MLPSRFNVRVYGLYLNQDREVLVTDEFRLDTAMTKFPGGGLEKGEGIEDCLKREWMEELSVEISVGKLFYINDFLQLSAFNESEQLLAIYYWVKPLASLPVTPVTDRFDFAERSEGAQTFRWISLDSISGNDLTFPIDKKVAALLSEL